MEKRKDSLSVLKICRFCLCQDETLTSLYDTTGKPKNAIPIKLKILACMSIEVYPSDKMPTFICSKCKFFLDLSFDFKQVFRQADENILQYVQNGVPLQTVKWPLNLLRILPNASMKTSPPNIMRTVLRDGATVQVTSQDIYDIDDDESVFNIKIGGGPNDERKIAQTTIKVVTNDQPQSSRNTEKSQPDSKDTEADLPAVRSGCFPCDQCYCTYPLQQLLELHKSQKHRERTVSCHQCDAKFFTKYDLMTHQLRHSDEMPFQCVACGRKFRRLVLLKRHEKLMHGDIPQMPCPNCPATFLSIEEVTAHQKKHAKSQNRRFPCSLCPKRFYEKTTLQRHIDVIHHNKPGFRCEYCPEQFSSVSKLTRHVRTHASPRGYPCKYCDKSFLKSHHYTRHLRVKHREAVRSIRGPFGQADIYRCEQCDDSFGTQDELIYHSAIHATQNLTCPLCQEKFENVDEVTSHIKSHVNGVEFMCDYCELVFTSKAKLDSHMASSHNEETDIPLPDESSMDVDDEDEDEDDNSAINVKEEDDHMVVEIKKPADFIVNNNGPDTEEKNNTQSEDSDAETIYTELATVDTLSLVSHITNSSSATETTSPKPTPKSPVAKTEKAGESNQTASILRKAEEIKRKVQQKAAETPKVTEKEKPNNKPESTNSAGASDKSLRLLEKELQELQRTNTRNEAAKAATKTVESLRSRRPQVHTSTPKTRAVEEKKTQAAAKSPAVEKKLPERKAVTKENKEPKEKEAKTNNASSKDDKESKDKDTPKSAVKNGGTAAEKSTADESIRRSTRPSKIKDYAKMVRDKAQDSEEDDSDMDDEEYDIEENRPSKPTRRSAAKSSPKPAGTPARKRGRPRKEPLKEVPNKMKKNDSAENEDDPAEKSDKEDEAEVKNSTKPAAQPDKPQEEPPKEPAPESNVDTNSDAEPKPASGVLVSPTGQTLKKVQIKALPPGVKPLPLPMNARPMGPGELCEMQIGKKVVKVQKIVMTKAEVEAMAKKGLVEMKDGNMVLKAGIKLPTADPVAIKSSLVGDKDTVKESPAKKDKAPAQEKEIS